MSLASFGPDQFDDDWNELGTAVKDSGAQTGTNVHIRIQQRNGKKTLTTVQGIPPEIDFPRLLKAFKKQFCCNGTVVDDPELGHVIQLQGDQRQNVRNFIVSEGMVSDQQIKVHGF
eukprot:TRINITY_DN928_c0_g2_i7.p3 TRINITY_DN928_c0_g2~~TRINITY_DN928_c0_g2_i7.p3  ORF type:complete len:116 (+),score=58.15 TRINITY_DN928_c0_g2_i7:190-537(+)